MKPRFLLGGLGAALAVGAAVLSFPRAADATRSLPIWKLKAVLVKGNCAIAESQLISAAGLTRGENIFTIDLAAAAERVARNPWVSGCRLARILPDRIIIEVTERTPAAVFQNGDGFHLADDSGALLQKVETPSTWPSLPLVTAGDATVSAADAVATGIGIARAMALWKGSLPPVSEIVVFSGGGAEVFAIDRPLRVILPSGPAEGAVHQWASLGPLLASFGEKNHSLDLRHRGRAYLRQEVAGGTQG